MMDVNTQSKILKAIEEKKIMRVGGTEAIPVDVRIIAAVNVNPRICLKKQDLREALYFRLRVVELKVPPLRERKEDIPQLVDFFIQYYNHKMGKYIVGLSEGRFLLPLVPKETKRYPGMLPVPFHYIFTETRINHIAMYIVTGIRFM